MKSKYLVYSWLGQVFAAPLRDIEEVLDLNHMAKTSREELKLTIWKNRTLPVLDPVSLLTIEETPINKQTRILVVNVKNMKVGFLVERIISVEELKTDSTKEPNVSEKRFVKNIIGEYKTVDFSHFVNSETLPLLKKAYNTNINIVLNGEELLLERVSEREGVIESLKLETLNFLIESNKRQIDDYYINGMLKIHKMVEKM